MKIEMTRFCTTDDSRCNLLHPWQDGDLTIASNGYCMVVVESDYVEPYEAPDPLPGRQPEWRKVIEPERPNVAEYVPLADWYSPVELRIKACDACNGTNKPDCPECAATGKVQCNYEHEHECPDCGGAGRFDQCLECGGTGVETEKMEVALPTGVFDARYLNMIAELPGIKIAIRSQFERRSPMLFSFEYGEGVLMPRAGSNDVLGTAKAMHRQWKAQGGKG